MPTLGWTLVFVAIFCIGLTKSGFGAGLGLFIIPLTAIACGLVPSLGSERTLGLLLPVLVVGDVIAVWQYRDRFSVEHIKRLLPGTLAGVVLGAAALWWLHNQRALVEAIIRTEIGLESILLVGLHWWRQYKGLQQSLMPEPTRSMVTGAFAGVSSTLAHAAGPIIAMYLLPLKLDRRVFVGTSATYFFMLNAIKIPGYFLSGQLTGSLAVYSLRFAPLVLLGAIVGLWLNRKVSDKLFSRIVYLGTFLLGWYLLYDGVTRLVQHALA